MVLYFSATGNTEFVAKHIAKRIGDEALNLQSRIREYDYSPIVSSKPFIICSPVYVCEMPRFLADYIRKLPLKGSRKIYFIFTSGGYSGIAGYLTKRMAKAKKMIYMGHADFKMPRNYPVSRRYPLLSDEENKKRLKDSYMKIPSVAARIKRGEKLKSRYITQVEKIITLPFNPVWVKKMHVTEPFCTTDKCIGCGKCARVCPLNRITMVDKKPEWEGNCAHCMGCIANCPVRAIEYGDITKGQKMYKISNYVRKKYL